MMRGTRDGADERGRWTSARTLIICCCLAATRVTAAATFEPRLVAARPALDGTPSASPDGRFTAVAGTRELRVYATESGLEVAAFDGLDLDGVRMVWAPDGGLVVAGVHADSTHDRVASVAVLSVEQNRVQRRRTLSHFALAPELAVSATRVTVATTGLGSSHVDRISYPDLEDAAPLTSWSFPFPMLSPDGRWVVGKAERNWRMRSIDTGEEVVFGRAEPDSSRALFVPDRPLLVLPVKETPGCERPAIVWDLSRGAGETWCDFPRVSATAAVRVVEDAVEIDDGETLLRRPLRRTASTARTCFSAEVLEEINPKANEVVAEWELARPSGRAVGVGDRSIAELEGHAGPEPQTEPPCFVPAQRRRADVAPEEVKAAPVAAVRSLDDVEIGERELRVYSRKVALRW
jgi:hypothetical protein